MRNQTDSRRWLGAVSATVAVVFVAAGVGFYVLNHGNGDRQGEVTVPGVLLTAVPAQTGASVVTQVPMSSNSPEPVEGALNLTDEQAEQAQAAAQDAALAVVTQLEGEGRQEREKRLQPLFTIDSSTPGADPVLDLAKEGITNGRVDAIGIDWTEPSDPGDGQISFIVAVRAFTTGLCEGMDGEEVLFSDTSVQLFGVIMTNVNGVWAPESVLPANE